MNDPRLPPLSSSVRALLANERVPQPTDAALRQRVLKRARVAIAERPSGVGLRIAGQTSRAARPPRTILLVAAAVAIAGLAAAGVNIYGLGRAPAPSLVPTMPPPAPPVAAPQQRVAPLPVAPPSVVPPSVVEAEPPDAQRALVTTTTPEPTRAPSPSTFALELTLLEPARRSIAHSDFTGALAAIARHQREFPRGQLAEERAALRVRALWGMGDKVAAESAAAVFRKRYPQSGLLSWMKAAATPE